MRVGRVDVAPASGVVVAYLASAMALPVSAVTLRGDEWIFYRALERFVGEGVLRPPDTAAMNLVFQTVWMGLPSWVFGPSPGLARLSVALLVAISGLALSDLIRQLGGPPGARVIGVAAYLFNPLVHVLGFSIMTDGAFLALCVIATALLGRGLTADARMGWLVAGSTAATAAFLVRQQGILVIVAAAIALAATAPGRRQLLRRLVAVATVPAVSAAAFMGWLAVVGVPQSQQDTTRRALQLGPRAMGSLVAHLGAVELGYLGLFVLPLVALIVPGIGRGWRSSTPARRGVAAGAFAVPVLAAVWLHGEGRRLPLAHSWLGWRGVGPDDVYAPRPPLVSGAAVTFVLFAATLAASALLAHVALRGSVRRGAPALVLSVVVVQGLACVLPSATFFPEVITFDRYLAFLVPFGVALAAGWARPTRVTLGIAWVMVAIVGVTSVAATGDSLRFQAAAWATAEQAVASGVGPDHLDGGAGWTGYRLYDRSRELGTGPGPDATSPWVWFWGLGTDAEYVVAGGELPGYTVISTRPYSQWLGRDGSMLLLRRTARTEADTG